MQHRKRLGQRAGLVLLVLAAGLFSAGWWSINETRRGQAVFSILEHTTERWWASVWGQDLTRKGQISGTVRDIEGHPLTGATVVVSTQWGRTFSAQTDEQGQYQIDSVPVGWTVPAATACGYQVNTYAAPLWAMTDAVRVRPGQTTPGIDFCLTPLVQPSLPEQIEHGSPELVDHDYPHSTQARRTLVTFERNGFTVNAYIYEPANTDRTDLPGLIAAYPGLPLDWEPASMAFVAQGYVVLGIGPVSMREMDITPDTEDLIVAMTLFGQGELSARVDTERIVALGGSFSSLALLRALPHVDDVRGVVLLGGLTDAYRLRYDVYTTDYRGHTEFPHLERVLWGLGHPDRAPTLYLENSPVFAVQGLPPLCLIHGTGDGVIPHTQSELLAQALDDAGLPYELDIYEGTGHYPGIYAPDPDTEAMYYQMLRFFQDMLAKR
ncbi:MAG: carboxypeptidase regulatory-like domain-containing protein [Anaerolineae bacterium]|nr:carboxypeptidase regulatory-like domain-containing protein [Anaerolineae bacterium]